MNSLKNFENKYPDFAKKDSYRIGNGAGTGIELTENLSLEIKRLFNINTSILSCHQLLIGISI